jgi:hypothetical protein
MPAALIAGTGLRHSAEIFVTLISIDEHYQHNAYA